MLTKPFLRLPTLFLAAAALSCGVGAGGTPGARDGAGSPGADAASSAAAAGSADHAPLRVMTFNVRYGNARDGDDAWPHRRALVLRVVEEHDPAVLGVQEALRFQLDEIRSAMDEPGEVGVGRDDGKEAGEYSAILYDRGRLALLDHGTFWLSDTPTVPGSMTWGNRFPRLVTWAQFRDSASGVTFYALNTHWDHESQNARERSARQIVDWIADHAAGQPLLLMGDFNAGEDNPAFTALLGSADRGVRLRDTFRAVHPHADTVGTFHGFIGDRTRARIDAVLASPEWDVLDAEIVVTNDDGRYPSDHFPVTATLLFDGQAPR